MKRLYAPWRNDYTKKVTDSKDEIVTQDECVFCQQFKENKDTTYFIVRRFTHTVVMLNLYPYNAGHILILPLKHYPDLHAMSPQERFELMELITITTELLKKALHAQGINVGLNLGKAAGAGIPSHLHMHIIPRWIGDTNFFPLIAETKQISTDLHEIYKQLLPYFHEIDEKIIVMKGSHEKKSR
jgi:ATP adenylyltransferase